jgi:glycolate oxidase iron-sulfur subunit
VEYGHALEATRATLLERRTLPIATRALHAVIAEPKLRRVAFGIARLFRPAGRMFAGTSRLGMAWGMLAATRQWVPASADIVSDVEPDTPVWDGLDHTRPAVTVFRGCIMDDLFGHVHAATERVLRANGFALVDAPAQGCCGALHVHAGQRTEAVAMARLNLAACDELHDNTLIAVNAAGCGAMLKELGHLFTDSDEAARATQAASRVRDVTEILEDAGPRPGAPLNLRVVYDPPCHLLHAQGIARAPDRLLEAIPGLTRLSHVDADQCCGSAGTYSFAQPEMAAAVLRAKTDAIADADPDVVVTGNPGCIMQIGAGLRAAGLDIPVVHPVELLDWSYEQAGYYRD